MLMVFFWSNTFVTLTLTFTLCARESLRSCCTTRFSCDNVGVRPRSFRQLKYTGNPRQLSCDCKGDPASIDSSRPTAVPHGAVHLSCPLNWCGRAVPRRPMTGSRLPVASYDM